MYVWLGVSECWRSSLCWLWCAYRQQSLDLGLRSSLIGGSPLISITSKLVFFSYLLPLSPPPLCLPFSLLHMVLAVSFPLFSSIFSPSTIFFSLPLSSFLSRLYLSLLPLNCCSLPTFPHSGHVCIKCDGQISFYEQAPHRQSSVHIILLSFFAFFSFYVHVCSLSHSLFGRLSVYNFLLFVS